ncbi:hypothetical protein IFM89_039851 [Coptis chinensis]|uniref:Methyltransferase domain-containing protein n=1 Tax=Coptis chinensis TaxID=261450 RepID=A0A835GTG4_9MAGN|nr:hypothetical protein IFM89_039851 [Coptis chinensis]
MEQVEILAAVVNSIAKTVQAQTVLDIGAGQGYLAQVLNFQYQLYVVAIDASSHHSTVTSARAARIMKHYAAKMRKSQTGTKELNLPQTLAFQVLSSDALKTLSSSIAREDICKQRDEIKKDLSEGLQDVRIQPPSCDIPNLKSSLVLAELHACGDLSTFLDCEEIKAVISIGCCYNLLSDEGFENVSSQRGFPMSCVDLAGFSLGKSARNLACQNSTSTWGTEEPSIWDAVEPDSSKKQSRSKKSRRSPPRAKKGNRFYYCTFAPSYNLKLEEPGFGLLRAEFEWRDRSSRTRNREKYGTRLMILMMKMMMTSHAWQVHTDRTILGLPPTGPSKIDAVKTAFRSSALKWHPDKHQGPSQGSSKSLGKKEIYIVTCEEPFGFGAEVDKIIASKVVHFPEVEDCDEDKFYEARNKESNVPLNTRFVPKNKNCRLENIFSYHYLSERNLEWDSDHWLINVTRVPNDKQARPPWGFAAEIDDDTLNKLKALPDVLQVLPDYSFDLKDELYEELHLFDIEDTMWRITNLQGSRAQIRGVAAHTQAMYASTAISTGMKGATKAMVAMNKVCVLRGSGSEMAPAGKQKVIKEFQKESPQMDMTLSSVPKDRISSKKVENVVPARSGSTDVEDLEKRLASLRGIDLNHQIDMLSESIDETLDKDELEETEELTNQVLDEIGVDIASQLSSAPKGRISSKKVENVVLARPGSTDVEDLEKRLASLRRI